MKKKKKKKKKYIHVQEPAQTEVRSPKEVMTRTIPMFMLTHLEEAEAAAAPPPLLRPAAPRPPEEEKTLLPIIAPGVRGGPP